MLVDINLTPFINKTEVDNVGRYQSYTTVEVHNEIK